MDAINSMLAKLSSQNVPEHLIWLFITVNLLWVAIIIVVKYAASVRYFKLQKSLNLELERRRKVYELKLRLYEKFCDELNSFCLSHRNDYQNVFLPLFNEFNNRYRAAETAVDTAASSMATLWLSGEIQKVTSANSAQLLLLDKQTAELRLSAADDVAAILDDIRMLYQQLLVVSSEQMSKLVAIALSKDYNAVKYIEDELKRVGNTLHTRSQQLMQAMRCDLMQF